MNSIAKNSQSGFALLIFVVVLLGAGGLLITGFSQGVLKEVHSQQYKHNRKVLEQAKEALLMYAYNYPEIALNFGVPTIRGPGRLPCPDTNNSGTPNPPCTSGEVGRFPVNADGIQFYDAVDSSGAPLWYAVSSAFYNQVGVVNSNTQGTITIFDQTGNILYDGATNGVAAVIIAPGSPLAGQDRVADPLDPSNYLDAFGGFDNSVFVNSSNADDDGFRIGPVTNNTTLVINDQFIIITAAEVIEVAEKATLQAYRDALRDYQQKIWGTTTASYRYPWLDLYETDDLTEYDAEFVTVVSDPVAGRVPSIFGNYFSGTDSVSIESVLDLEFRYDGLTWNATSAIADVFFNGSADLVTNSTYSSVPQTLFFWDGHDTLADTNSPNDGVWELCTGNAGTEPVIGTGNPEDDCNRKTDGNYKIPTDSDPEDSDVWLKVKRITVQFNSGAAALTFLETDREGPPVDYTEPFSSQHAMVYADYDDTPGYLDIMASDFDNDFQEDFDDQGNGPLFGVDAADRIRVGIRFYPELPAWTRDNQWHDNVTFVYSAALKPNGDGNCTQPVLPFDVVTDLTLDYCLVVENSGGVTTDKSALLMLAGDNTGLVDDGPIAALFFAEELEDIFEGENGTPAIRHDDSNGYWSDYYNPAPAPPLYELLETNLKFDRRPANDTGNDIVLVLD